MTVYDLTKVRKVLNSFNEKLIVSLTGWKYILQALSVVGIKQNGMAVIFKFVNFMNLN